MKKITLIVALLMQMMMSNYAHAELVSYEKYIGQFVDVNGEAFIVLRKFTRQNNSVNNYVVVNPISLQTKVLNDDDAKEVQETDWQYLESEFQDTPYIRLRNEGKQSNRNRKKKYSNNGIGRAQKGLMITTDLCPTAKGINKALYENIITFMSKNSRKKVPIGVAISGKWMETHEEDLQWLKNENFSITWINHSYSHSYTKGIPVKNNFMLKKGTNVHKEILATEKLMLQADLSMSVYFRFPGLISDKKLYQQVLDYGLIPLGSNSWIAKNQRPKRGSVILVHGNGNEPLGVKKLIQWMRSQKNIFKATSLNLSFR